MAEIFYYYVPVKKDLSMASENIHQIFLTNPITSNVGTDLMYFGQSPYGITNDAAMLYSDFAKQFSPLTTKGDLYTFSTVNARLAVGTVDGQILQVHSAASTGLAWSTPTYPSASGTAGQLLRSDGTNNLYSTSTYPNTNAINTLLYASAINVMSALATANSAVLTTSATGVPTWSSTLINGQLIIGSTGAAPVAATLTAGTNISITNGAGSITINGTGAAGFTWNDVTSGTQTLAVNQGYVTDNGASLVTYTLPTTAALGSIIEIAGFSSGLFTVAQNTGQKINFGNQSTTVTTGSITSTNANDYVRLLCVQANTIFTVTAGVGNFTIV